MPQLPRVLVVEDEAKSAATLRLYLEKSGFEARVARDGAEGLSIARSWSPDLLLLDIMLPEVDGLSICRALRAESDVPILLLSARTTEEDRLRGLRLGADDYVTKPFSPREVVARVRAILRRTKAPEEREDEILRSLSLEITMSNREARVRGRVVDLPPAEFSLLVALARSPGRVFSREELVERAFGPGYDGLDRTIDAHVMRLRRKIEQEGHPALLVTVFGVGYKLADSNT